MNREAKAKQRNLRRKLRIKNKLKANNDRLRLCLSKSNKNFYAQIIDDVKGHTLVGVSSMDVAFSDSKGKNNIDVAKKLGKLIAEKAVEKGLKSVVFDRNGNLYHGKIKAFADSARENGLEF